MTDTGFLQFKRGNFESLPAAAHISEQSARCMDCGIPFCHNACPTSNLVPDWNNLVYRDQWRKALSALHSTNNFPEFTGHICPAPCEQACVLNIGDADGNPFGAVAIKYIERTIVSRGWDEGWIVPEKPARITRKKVAIVGSGPAGMACAQQLTRAGHIVTVFEKDDRIGGLVRYGVPDPKMDKWLIDRRVGQMQAEGTIFKTGIDVGTNDLSASELLHDFDAVALMIGSRAARDLDVDGRVLEGVHLAMNFLTQANKRGAGDDEPRAAPEGTITAKGKHVAVIGGGYTGADCIQVATMQGAAFITQIDLYPARGKTDQSLVWPGEERKFHWTSSHKTAHAAGILETIHGRSTQRFLGLNGHVRAVEYLGTAIQNKGLVFLEGTGYTRPADIVLLANGFTGPAWNGLEEGLAFAFNPARKGFAAETNFQTTNEKIFVGGDGRIGPSLVVSAIREGRRCARAVDTYLMGSSLLPN